MRRRFGAAVIAEQMERGNGKNQNNRLCVLTTLCVLFWSLLLYFHFVVLGSRPGDDPSLLQSNSIRIEPRPTNVAFSNDIQLKNDAIETHGSDKLGSNPIATGRSSGDPVENNVATFQSDRKINAGSKPTNPSPEKVEPRDEPSPEKVEPKDDPSPENFEPREEPSPEKVEPKDEPSPEKAEPKDEPSPQKVEPKDEQEEFLFMKALRTAENKSDPCGGRYIYVHDLPSRFNEDMLKECRSLSLWTNMCKFIINAGLGPPLENVDGVFSTTGWYATNQFAVDVIFNNRMKQYECLTNDSSLAAAVFVPFYAGFDIARYLWGYNISMRDAASLDLVDWLMKRPEWKIMNGRDHFLVAGRITWDFRRLSEEETDWGSKLLFLPAAKNMSMLVVESSPWNANDFAIPYPTYFHPAKDEDVFVWQDRMRNLERPFLFSFAGAPRPGNPKSIRGQLIDQCKNSNVCKLLECDFGESKCHSPSSIMKMFQSSLFCLQPQGDSYTRRSAFDSMLAGCIPVFFHPGSAYTQYTWHLPKNYTTYSVFIPENEVRKGMVNIEERLKQIPPEQVKVMRETVISLIPNLIYADPRSKLETLQDAFDVSVRAIIDKVTRLRKNIIQGRTEYDDFIEENSWKYALLEGGQREVGAHPWDPFFSKPKEGEEDFNGGSTTNAEAAKNSWKNEQRSH